MTLSPEWVNVLLWVLGLFMGGGAAMFYGRRMLAEARNQSALQRTQYEARITEYEGRMQQLDRQLAGDEAELRGLRERLDESRDALNDKNLELAAAQNRISDLDRRLTRLQAEYEEKQVGLETLKQSFEQSREQLKTEFQNLANKVLEEKGRLFTQSSTSSLDAMLKPFREQISAFQQRINQVHDESVKGNASLGTEIKQVLEVGMRMSAEANNLTLALKGDKKTTGTWGEIQLEKTLELAGLVKGDHYEAQPRFKDGEGQNRQPDFVIKLPDNKHMVIDSKVSLVDYDRALSAETEAEQGVALQAHVKAVKQHIDDLSRKDYTNLIGMRSPSFVLMFMPIESAYIEALKNNRDLFNYGYQRNVVMVSHTTLMPIMKTVANLWMVARSSAQAQELSDRAGEIYNQVAVVAENLKKLGDTLGTVSNHYNRTVTALAGRQGLYGKVNRFNELSAKANKTLPPIEPHHVDYQVERLSLMATEPDAKPDSDK
jgi:DNA recombination protein RmuC